MEIEAKKQQEDCTKTEVEAEVGGGRKGVAGVEATTKGRRRVVQKGEGSVVETGTIGGTTCTH